MYSKVEGPYELETMILRSYGKEWINQDRLLELLCSIVSIDGMDTLFIQDACFLRVGTAYEPGQDDEAIKQLWLKENPSYEATPDGVVRKKGKNKI